jgi:hypothetical protein
MSDATSIEKSASNLTEVAPPQYGDGMVIGATSLILRLEGAAILLAASVAYAQISADWTMFAVLFLVPDISMVGYLAGRRIGAAVYNVGHTTLGPILSIALGWYFGVDVVVSLGLIWLAHIGFDRAIGYGLKYADRFTHTHLGALFPQRR